jgi:hypothetical protein
MMQVLEMTDEEKVAMYMKCTKAELVKMLIESNKQLNNVLKPTVQYPVLGPRKLR